MPSSPDHVPAARLPLGRAFPKGRAAGRPQGRWAQESWGPGGRGLGGRGAGGHRGRLRPPTGPVGHGCRRPGPLGQPGVRRTMALSSWVFRRPCLSSAVPGASVETGGWGPFRAGRLCHRFVRPCGGDNTGHLPFHPLDKARDGSRAMAVTVRPLSIWALEGSPGSKEAAPRPHRAPPHRRPLGSLHRDPCLFPREDVGSPSMPGARGQLERGCGREVNSRLAWRELPHHRRRSIQPTRGRR